MGNYASQPCEVDVLIPTAAFLQYVRDRRDSGESLASIGSSLGVSRVAVSGWLSGARKPSTTAVLLGSMLQRAGGGTWPL